MRRQQLLFLLAALGACRATTSPVVAPATPASVAAAAPAGRAAFHARCDVDRAQEFPDWDAWAREKLPDPPPGWHFDEIKGEELAKLEPILRRGLEACDWRAPIVAMEGKVRSLVPVLRDVVEPANLSASLTSQDAPMFRLMVANALTALDPDTDYAPSLLPLLAHPNDRVRMGAAFHAREYRLASVKAALLDRVRDDAKAPVRRQAAESLFVLAGVKPPFVHGHKGLTDVIDSDTPAARERARKMVEQLVGAP
jgi:hypothetical protein